MMMTRFLQVLLFCPLLVLSANLPYAEWAHYHMVWLPNSHTNQADIQAMFDGYLAHQIPVGILNIDSRWATNFNTFIFNSTQFPNIRQMLDGIRTKNVHIVLWMTSFINIDSPTYQYAQDHAYLFNRTIQWWHGQGRLLNYFNLHAVDWWHSQIARLLDSVGPIHAFKVKMDIHHQCVKDLVCFLFSKADASDPYIIEVLDPSATWLRYRTAYYNDTFQILRRLVGPEALIMSRPVDADLDYSPRDIVFMGWVGDEDGTYNGLETAIRYMLASGRRGYVGFGSDIGGYRIDPNAGPLGRTKELFLRWTAIGALSSFMENGGNGEHLPWNFDAETVDIYRFWVNLHYNLVPYLFTEGTKAALAGNGTLMQPCDDIEALFTHTYFFGPKIYVVPVLRDPTPNQTQRLWLPASATNKWINAFNTSQIHPARTFIHEDTSRLDRIPMYIQQSSLIPMYDLERSPSLDTFKFVLWGEALFDKQSTSLFTRDGQEWKIEFDRIQRRLTTHFVRIHNSNHDKQSSIWTWQFCQYARGEQICSTNWSQLREGAWNELKILV